LLFSNYKLLIKNNKKNSFTVFEYYNGKKDLWY
jgi:hypothetical protein